MFADQMKYDSVTKQKLERINSFLALFYTPRWMTATAAADAPLQDITFVQEMMKYEAIDPEVAIVVQRKLQNHGWYLTQELSST